MNYCSKAEAWQVEDWNGLSPTELVSRCLQMAREARDLAKCTSPNMNQAYRQVAEEWVTLAEQIVGQTASGLRLGARP